MSDEERPPEPEAPETESAALLANEAAARLPDLDHEEVRELADRFIAEGNDGGAEVFVPWVRRVRSQGEGSAPA